MTREILIAWIVISSHLGPYIRCRIRYILANKVVRLEEWKEYYC